MRSLQTVGVYLLALLILLFFLFPLVWVFLTSFKTRVQIFGDPLSLWFRPTLENYEAILRSDFMRQMGNSFIIALTSTLFSLALATPLAYAFSRFPGQLPHSDNWLFWVLSLRMLPPIAVVVPFYLLLRALGLLDTHLALIALYSIFNISFATWLLKGFFDEIPTEVEEAAMLDGWRPHQIVWRVSLPMARSGLVAAGLFCLIQSLNEFLLALLLTAERAVTAPVAIANFQRFFGLDWGQMSAGAILFMTPTILFTLFVRHHLMRGVSFGAERRG